MSKHAGQFGGISLFDAAADGDVEALRARLASTHTRVDKQDGTSGDTAAHEASRWGHHEVVSALLAAGASVLKNKEGQTPLHLAAAGGHVETIRVLVAGGAELSAQDNDLDTPLHSAAAKGKQDAIRVLLELGADKASTNARRQTPAGAACDAATAALLK